MTPSPPQSQITQIFPLLAAPDRYVACGVDLGADAHRRAYWLKLFRGHFPSLVEEALHNAEAQGQDRQATRRACEAASEVFSSYLDDVEREPEKYGRLDILAICAQREQALRRAGLADPYQLAKAKENETALSLLPKVLAELDSLGDTAHTTRLIEGIFAGNIFDLGVTPTLELFKSGGLDFHSTRSKLKPRPWLIDDLDAWLDRWSTGPPHRCAVLFVDNAGFDIVLGMIPFARALLGRGTGVILTANTTASLNDITHDELCSLIERIAQWDDTLRNALAEGQLELIPSGNGVPLIDLTTCSHHLIEAVNRRKPDLVVLEGMGRALESNFHARLACDTIKIAMVKDQGVAGVYGGEVFDLVFRFEAAEHTPCVS